MASGSRKVHSGSTGGDRGEAPWSQAHQGSRGPQSSRLALLGASHLRWVALDHFGGPSPPDPPRAASPPRFPAHRRLRRLITTPPTPSQPTPRRLRRLTPHTASFQPTHTSGCFAGSSPTTNSQLYTLAALPPRFPASPAPGRPTPALPAPAPTPLRLRRVTPHTASFQPTRASGGSAASLLTTNSQLHTPAALPPHFPASPAPGRPTPALPAPAPTPLRLRRVTPPASSRPTPPAASPAHYSPPTPSPTPRRLCRLTSQLRRLPLAPGWAHASCGFAASPRTPPASS
ncbi:hypothetical protein EV192_11621 [Actinocrispum wychmicini]|uniref:Uncharacterized protein n=1 Tax=Actinocrispum wychmicini TaxID=1213861 RepID=A0A4R2IUL4_9PSEU|nr:hypothetical protein EV192_11621 [Actinocrispum wychmicini]